MHANFERFTGLLCLCCRMFVWRSLLCLPENHAAYSSLTDKGLHSAYLTLHDKYPIKSHKLQRGLQRWPLLLTITHTAAHYTRHECSSCRINVLCCYLFWNHQLIIWSFPSLCRVLSALAHWAAIFGEVEYLPLVAFPFVKLFQNNPMLCFEVVATVIGT